LGSEEKEKAKMFLEDLTPEVEEAHIDILIAAQAEVVTTAEKKLKQLQTDSVELQNKITKLQEEMSVNSKAQETQLTEIANQRKILEAIKSRKKI
jgi:Pyruvate/2-oxoacid:ferredoxin oxidoreductase gamma subunit